LALPIPGVVSLAGGWELSAAAVTVDYEQVRDNHDPWQAFVDLGDEERLIVRTRRPGERFQPLGLGGRSASVQDVMVNRKLARRWRGRWPIVACSDYLVWIVGGPIDERVRVAAATRRIIQLRCVKPH
jgi:tRNA(Ile)-lysidine synthase